MSDIEQQQHRSGQIRSEDIVLSRWRVLRYLFCSCAGLRYFRGHVRDAVVGRWKTLTALVVFFLCVDFIGGFVVYTKVIPINVRAFNLVTIPLLFALYIVIIVYVTQRAYSLYYRRLVRQIRLDLLERAPPPRYVEIVLLAETLRLDDVFPLADPESDPLEDPTSVEVEISEQDSPPPNYAQSLHLPSIDEQNNLTIDPVLLLTEHLHDGLDEFRHPGLSDEEEASLKRAIKEKKKLDALSSTPSLSLPV